MADAGLQQEVEAEQEAEQEGGQQGGQQQSGQQEGGQQEGGQQEGGQQEGGQQEGGQQEGGRGRTGAAPKKLSKKERKDQKAVEKADARRREQETERLSQLRAFDSDVPDEGEDEGTKIMRRLVREKCVIIPKQIGAIDETRWDIGMEYGTKMRVTGRFFANVDLAESIFAELAEEKTGAFTPAVKQLANVATLPGIIGHSLGMPDMHSGYGFAVGCVAAVNLDDPNAVVSPGGVGFDINCGVRLIRTNIKYQKLQQRPKLIKQLADSLFATIPVGVGCRGEYHVSTEEMDAVLKDGMKWCLGKGFCFEDDLTLCEDGGCIEGADPRLISKRAKQRGVSQLGTLGGGNHYIEIQTVDEVYDEEAATVMGLDKDTVCVMIHSGSRGLGHQVCTDFLESFKADPHARRVWVPDAQLTSVPANTEQGKRYLSAMAAAANFAFCNRTLMAHSARRAFSNLLECDAEKELGMRTVYDVSHNIAKVEKHNLHGVEYNALVHRKGATRAFGPGQAVIPEKYRAIGQPVLIGGSMGTASYVLLGTEKAMQETFGSTCHGAGRLLSRSRALREVDSANVLANLEAKGIEVRVASPKLISEESDAAYKNVEFVVETCHRAGISKKCVRMRPLAVVKG